MNTRPAVLSLVVCATLAATAAAQTAPALPNQASAPTTVAGSSTSDRSPEERPRERLEEQPEEQPEERSGASLNRLASQPSSPVPMVGPTVAPMGEPTVSPAVDWSGESRRLTAPGFGRIFQDLGNDFRRLPSRGNALLLGIGAGLAGFAAPSDRRLTSSMHGADEDVGQFLGPGQHLGNFYFALGGSFATYAIGRATGSTKTAIVGADLARAQILAQATTQGIKFLAGRTRPNGDGHSFPSGHTSSAFATATVLQQHFGWKVGIPAYAVAGYVGASRLNANKHYLSDVAFGAALGIVAGRTVTVGIGSTKFALQPIAAQGGVGIGFTKVQKK